MQNSSYRVPVCHALPELIVQFALNSEHLTRIQTNILLNRNRSHKSNTVNDTLRSTVDLSVNKVGI